MVEQTNGVNILRGMLHLSPHIFNLFSEEIFREALEDTDKTILLNGERMNNWYADETVFFTDNINNLQVLMNKIKDVQQ